MSRLKESESSSVASTVTRTSFSRLRRLASKELREILRDRRTIITLVLMPLLVYPLLGIVVQKFLLSNASLAAQNEYHIVLQSREDKELLEELLFLGEDFADQVAEGKDPFEWLNRRRKENQKSQKPPEDQKTKNGKGAAEKSNPQEKKAEDPNKPKIKIHVLRDDVDIKDLIEKGHFDLAIEIQRHEDDRFFYPPLGAKSFEFTFADRSVNGKEAYDYVTKHLRVLQDGWTRAVAMKYRNPRLPRPLRLRGMPAQFKTELVPLPANTTSLLTFFPLMLVLMTITGAVYPAIDLTAGERERGTMEILIAAPVSRLALLAAKFVAVLAVAMLTAIFNMIAMVVTVYAIGLDGIIFGDGGLSVGVISQILLLLFVFAGFFSAVLLGLTSFARSFKEAQAYLIPVMLVALAPGLVCLMPGIEMNWILAVVPLVNIVLLGRDVLTGNVNMALWATALVSTVFYAFLAMAFAARVFGTDALFSGGSGTWSSMFRRPAQPVARPTLAQGMLCLAILFPAFIVIGGVANRLGGEDVPHLLAAEAGNVELANGDEVKDEIMAMESTQRQRKLKSVFQTKLALNGLVLVLLFAVVPLLFAFAANLKFSTTFNFHRPRVLAIIGALLLGVSVWPLVYEYNIFALSEDRVEFLKELFGSMKFSMSAMPLWLKLLCLAIAPAICEELFFRGFLMSAFRQATSPVVAIVATAVIFGAFHVFVSDSLFFERFVPSALLGVLLGVLYFRTGSLIPGMIMHVVHNGLLMTISHYESNLKEIEWLGATDQSHLPIWVIGLSLILVLCGAFLALITGVKKPEMQKLSDIAD